MSQKPPVEQSDLDQARRRYDEAQDRYRQMRWEYRSWNPFVRLLSTEVKVAREIRDDRRQEYRDIRYRFLQQHQEDDPGYVEAYHDHIQDKA